MNETRQLERRYILSPAEFRAARAGDANGSPGGCSGWAAVWYDPKDPGTQYKLGRDAYERIAPGAFGDFLKTGEDVVALWNHNPDHLLGRLANRTLQLAEDKRGLHYQIELPDTNLGRDMAVQLARRDVTGASFGFYVTDDRYTEQGPLLIRTILKADLVDVSPVWRGAYDSASASPTDLPRSMPRPPAGSGLLEEWERQAKERKARIDALEADDPIKIAADARLRRLRLAELE